MSPAWKYKLCWHKPPPAWLTAFSPSKYSLVISGIAKACLPLSEPGCSLHCPHSLSSPRFCSHCLGSCLLKPPAAHLEDFVGFPCQWFSGCSQSFQCLMGRALLGYVVAQPHALLSLSSCEQFHEPLAITPYPKDH